MPSAAGPSDHEVELAAHLRALHALNRGLQHDLRGPLNSMVLNLELVKRSLDRPQTEGLVEKQRGWVDVVERELGQLQSSMDVILTQIAPAGDMQTFDLRDAVRDVRALAAAQARRQGARLEADLGEVSVPVKGCREEIQRALLLVVVNALEAVDTAGRIELRVRREGETATTEIADDGPGIADDEVEKIFDAGYSTRGRPGSGLTVARELATACDGSLGLMETGVDGSVFALRIPVADRGLDLARPADPRPSG